MILEALSAARGNRSRAAQILGIYRGLLYSKMKEYGLENEIMPALDEPDLAGAASG
jgi:DNA-binding NtrC family response regulator